MYSASLRSFSFLDSKGIPNRADRKRWIISTIASISRSDLLLGSNLTSNRLVFEKNLTYMKRFSISFLSS